jgi:hypothetical protein
MKTFLIGIILILTLSSCNKEKYANLNTENSNKPTLEGTWELVGYYNYIDDKIVDSFTVNNGYRQVKMYTSSKVMWSKDVPTDSTEWFGFGHYKATDSSLTETLDYGSNMMRQIIDERKAFNYELEITANRYSQIELDEQGNRIYSENYLRIE